jgi:L-aminopeptidase/D-esterase-like protein
MNRVGPRNAITDVPGIKVGNAEDHDARSGVTVVLPDKPVVATVDVRGGSTGTREIERLDPADLLDQFHGFVLSGGSAFGLAAADGVMSWLAARGRGFVLRQAVVPIVPAAILFDLSNGGDKAWGGEPPYRALGIRAAEAAGLDFALGNAGAGLGATAGLLKGGLGSASVVHEAGTTVGALAAVNSFGSVLMPKSSTFWAWPFERDDELGGQAPPPADLPRDFEYRFEGEPAANTTLVLVATDARLTKAEAHRVAVMAQDGLARAIRPVHTPMDGDTLFMLATCEREMDDPWVEVPRLGMMAADCVARAIARGVYQADSLGDMRSYRDFRAEGGGNKTEEGGE